jgi:hypothetical protein
MMRHIQPSRGIFSVAANAQNAKVRELTKAEISALLDDRFIGFTKKRQWSKAKSMLSVRSSSPNRGRLVGPQDETGSTRSEAFGQLRTTLS